MKDFFRKIKEKIERYIPMTIGNLLLFLFLLYLIFIVGHSIIKNYSSNHDIDNGNAKVNSLKTDIAELQNEINYFQTGEYREDQAREKLGYKSPGEHVVVLPLDKIGDRHADSGLTDAQIKKLNYQLWWEYFFGSR